MVLEGGHVPEFGPKKELLAKKGRFYQMANTVRGLHLDERGRGSVSAERFVRHGQSAASVAPQLAIGGS